MRRTSDCYLELQSEVRGDMGGVRYPAVAGTFYPEESTQLQAVVQEFLRGHAVSDAPPKALIVPHAGYVYSGPTAGTGYAQLAPLRETIGRVVLLGPAHFVPLRGLATSSAESFLTPLGSIAVDEETVARLLQLEQVQTLDEAHAPEHSLEVHLPFLQTVLADFQLVPLVVGEANADQVAEVLDVVWNGPETFIVVSSDLSHFHDHQTAAALDGATSRAIEHFEIDPVGPDQACGFRAIRGLLTTARRRGLCVTTLDLRNSGDTAGSRDRVVGYGAYAIG